MIWWTLLQHCCELVYNSMQVGAKFGANLEIREIRRSVGKTMGAKSAPNGRKSAQKSANERKLKKCSELFHRNT